MLDIIEAFAVKRAYIWVPNERTNGDCELPQFYSICTIMVHQNVVHAVSVNPIKINAIPDLLAKKLFLDDGNKDAFLGLRKLIDKDVSHLIFS